MDLVGAWWLKLDMLMIHCYHAYTIIALRARDVLWKASSDQIFVQGDVGIRRW